VSELASIKPAGVDAAERAYAAGRFAEARALFLAALGREESEDGVLLYDVGNCEYRLGDPAKAMLLWRRAALRLPRDEGIRQNLVLAARELGVEAPVRRGLGFASPIEAGIAGIALFAVGVAMATFGARKPLRVAGALAAVLGIAMAAWSVALRGSDAVVLTDEIAVRSDPHAEAPVTLRLPAGESVAVNAGSERWVSVEHPRGRGWTERSGLGIVE
jgi:hypothetical protein